MRGPAFLLFASLSLSAVAADLDSAIVSTQAEVKQEADQLRDTENRIYRERMALVRARSELAEQVTALRAELDVKRRAEKRVDDGDYALKQEIATLRDHNERIRQNLVEFQRSTQALQSIAEVQASALPDMGGLQPGEPVETARAAAFALPAWMELQERLIGGRVMEGDAVDAEGRVHSGTIVAFGPIELFAGEEKRGQLIHRGDPLLPEIVGEEEASVAIADLVTGTPARISVDVSGGKAYEVASAKKTWFERLQQGGFTLIPLLMTAAAATFLILWKVIALSRLRGGNPERVRSIALALRSEDSEGALGMIQNVRQPLRTILEGGAEHAGAERTQLEEVMHERMLAMMPTLDRHLGTIAVLAGIAPLLGLLGTVTGMIHTFELVTLFGSGNTRMMGGGITEALVTTMVGLSIAIPVLLCHAFLARRVRVMVAELEQSIALFIGELYREAAKK